VNKVLKFEQDLYSSLDEEKLKAKIPEDEMVNLKKFVEDTLKWMEDEHTTEEFEEKLKELNSTFQPMKYMSDEEKAEAMKKLNDAGKEHEEFRLTLAKEKEVELAQISIQKDIAQAQASVLAEAFKTANIDIVGGDNSFFDNVVRQISAGKGIDKFIQHSENAQLVKQALISNDGDENLIGKVMNMVEKYKISSEDIKNLSVASLIFQLKGVANDNEQGILSRAMNMAQHLGIENKPLK
jgi:hypothetical protein